MSNELICSALGLLPDRWPPDHYALLGLPPGAVDAATVEERVLERMDRLRRYQLAQPDAVTDAMNRLAQALVCLSDPAAKAAYDSTLPRTPAPAAPAVRAAAAEVPATYPLAPRESTAAAPVVLRPQIKSRRDDPRRKLYRRLAATRRLLTAWRAVGQHVAGSRRLRAIDGIDFVSALLELRDRLADEAAPPIYVPGRSGAAVAALVRQPLPLSVFRHMKPEQRSALASDWHAGLEQLTAVYAEYGTAVRRQSRSSTARTVRKAARRLLADRLDLLLFLMGLAALSLAMFRSR